MNHKKAEQILIRNICIDYGFQIKKLEETMRDMDEYSKSHWQKILDSLMKHYNEFKNQLLEENKKYVSLTYNF